MNKDKRDAIVKELKEIEEKYNIRFSVERGSGATYYEDKDTGEDVEYLLKRNSLVARNDY